MKVVTVGLACEAADLAERVEKHRQGYWSLVARNAKRATRDLALDLYIKTADRLEALRDQVHSS